MDQNTRHVGVLKTLYGHSTRTGITSTDSASIGIDGVARPGSLAPTPNCRYVMVSGFAHANGSAITGFLVFYDANSNPIGCSASITLTSGALENVAYSRYIAPSYFVEIANAEQVYFYVTSITGTWDVRISPY